jgi:hypothetical protein
MLWSRSVFGNPPFRLLLLSALLWTAVPTANAATITSSNSFSFTNALAGNNTLVNNAVILSNMSQQFDALSAAITLGKFDASLGTLNSISFAVTFSTSSTSGTVSFGDVSLLPSASLDRTVKLNISNVAFSDPIATSVVSTINRATLISIAGGTGLITNIAGPANFNSALFNSVGQKTALTGPGTFNVGLTSSDLYTLNKIVGLGAYTLSAQSSYVGNVTVTYDYTAVPEPSSYGLIGALFLGVVLGFRRYRAGGESSRA